MKKIWDKKSSTKVDPFNEAYLISRGVPDNELIPYDVKASKAHANMLASIGVLTGEENEALQNGLDKIKLLHQKGGLAVGGTDRNSARRPGSCG